MLDLGLPGLDGIEMYRQVRTFSDCYIVMLTARADEVDTLVGLSVGADDYVTKPFSPRELAARVGVLLRRPRRTTKAIRSAEPAAGPEPVAFGRLLIDVEGREVHVGADPVSLTRTEFDVLAALASRPHAVLTRRALIEAVWGNGWVGDEHLVDVHVLLGDTAAEQRFVRTVRGVGYRIGPGT